MTEGQMAELRALAEEASQGVWSMGAIPVPLRHMYTSRITRGENSDYTSIGLNDAAFIAAACPATVVELLDMIDGLRAALGES